MITQSQGLEGTSGEHSTQPSATAGSPQQENIRPQRGSVLSPTSLLGRTPPPFPQAHCSPPAHQLPLPAPRPHAHTPRIGRGGAGRGVLTSDDARGALPGSGSCPAGAEVRKRLAEAGVSVRWAAVAGGAVPASRGQSRLVSFPFPAPRHVGQPAGTAGPVEPERAGSAGWGAGQGLGAEAPTPTVAGRRGGPRGGLGNAGGPRVVPCTAGARKSGGLWGKTAACCELETYFGLGFC